jgi:hypothetical protein
MDIFDMHVKINKLRIHIHVDIFDDAIVKDQPGWGFYLSPARLGMGITNE